MKQYLQEALPRGYIAAYRFLGNREESHDACQEAAARALAAKDQYDHKRPFYPWFYRILKNLCLDRLKQRRRTTSRAEVEVVEKRHSAEAQLLAHEQSHVVNQAILLLTQEQREVIELRHFQDLSYEEMAEVLDCPPGTVMSRLYRARKALRKLLLEDPEFRFAHEEVGQ